MKTEVPNVKNEFNLFENDEHSYNPYEDHKQIKLFKAIKKQKKYSTGNNDVSFFFSILLSHLTFYVYINLYLKHSIEM